jgi:hypothetical protein
MARKNAGHRLEEARAALTEIDGKLAELGRTREQRLLAGDGAAEIAKLDAEIADLRHAQQTETDRIRLLEAEAAREANERRVKEKLGLIERVEKKLTERDAAAAELQNAIEQADKCFRKMITLARDVRAAWPWQAHDLPPALLGEAAIIAAVKHEIFRSGARPQLYGGQDKPGAGLSFPGGQAPRLELVGTPEKVPTLVNVVREATALASTIMRSGGKSTSVVTMPAVNGSAKEEPRERTTAEERLAGLHKRQAELAADPSPENEAAYQNVVAEIAEAAALVEAERTGAQS